MCLTHDSNPRAACGLKGPFRLVEVVYPHTQTNKQTTWSRPRLQDRSPRDIVVKSYKKTTDLSHVDGPTLNKASRLTWNNFAAGHVSIQNADFPGDFVKICQPSGAIFPLRMLKVSGPDHQNGRLWKTNMIHSEVSSCHACTILHSDVLSWTQKPRAEDPPRMQLVMLKTFCLLQVYIYILI